VTFPEGFDQCGDPYSGACADSDSKAPVFRCVERISNGVDFDACDDPAVLVSRGAPLCRGCAERRLERLESLKDEIRRAIR
jgi:hypothetical protein